MKTSNYTNTNYSTMTPAERWELDLIVIDNSAFANFEGLLDAKGGYRPTIDVSDADREFLADVYDAAQKERGDDRRAHRYGSPASRRSEVRAKVVELQGAMAPGKTIYLNTELELLAGLIIANDNPRVDADAVQSVGALRYLAGSDKDPEQRDQGVNLPRVLLDLDTKIARKRFDMVAFNEGTSGWKRRDAELRSLVGRREEAAKLLEQERVRQCRDPYRLGELGQVVQELQVAKGSFPGSFELCIDKSVIQAAIDTLNDELIRIRDEAERRDSEGDDL